MEIKNFIRQLLNYFFRGNNLFLTYLSALRNHNQIIISKKTDLKKCKFHISGSNNKIIIGDNCSLNSVVFYMNNNNSVIVGNDVIVNANEDCPTRLNACDGCSITIGDGCLFSNNIEIHTTDYHPIYQGTEMVNKPKSVIIGEHSWVGLRTVILKGVELAPNTIVGACSLVSSSTLNQNTSIAGCPAREIKNGITWKFSKREMINVQK